MISLQAIALRIASRAVARLRLVRGDEQERVAQATLRRAATRQCVHDSVGRGGLPDALAGVRQRRAQDHQRQRARLLDRDWIVRRCKYSIETALGLCVGAEHVGDSRVDFMLWQRLGPVLGEAIERWLGGKPVAAGFFIEEGGAFA